METVLVDLNPSNIVVGDSVLSVLVLSVKDVVGMSMVNLHVLRCVGDSLMVAEIEQLVERE